MSNQSDRVTQKSPCRPLDFSARSTRPAQTGGVGLYRVRRPAKRVFRSKRRRWRSKRRVPSCNVDDVLAGAVTPTAAELIALIHRVNPTDKGLHTTEENARYRQKSALQSLLINRFGDYLELEHDPDNSDVIGLRHRLYKQDAAHAVIAELDDDARSWVRHQFAAARHDFEVYSEGPTKQRLRTPAVRASAGDLLERGRAAAEEYDYDVARAAFTSAFEASGGAPEAALALLGLLVEFLGMNRDALALRERLSLRAREVSEVRGLLAVAAARAGDADAEDLIDGADPAHGVEALCEIGRRLVNAPDLEGAERVHRRACLLGGDDPDLTREVTLLAEEIDKARTAALEAAEGDLEARVATLTPEEALLAVERFLKAHPESRRATRLLRDCRRRRVAPDVSRLCGLAEQALVAGRDREARRLVREAAELDEASEQVKVLQTRVEAALEAARVEAWETSTAKLLVDGDLAAGLAAWHALPKASQGRVRAGVNLPVLDAFAILCREHRRQPADSLIAAACALQSATSHMTLDHAAAAVAALEEHWRLLRDVPAAVELHREAKLRASKQAQERAVGALASAKSALDAGNLELARDRMAVADASLLDPIQQEERTELEGHLVRAEAAQSRLHDAQEAWRQAGPFLDSAVPWTSVADPSPLTPGPAPRLLAARDAIGGLLMEPGCQDRALWAGRLAEARNAERVHASPLALEGADAVDVGLRDIVLRDGRQWATVWGALPDGNLVAVDYEHDVLSSRVVDPCSSEVIRATSIRLPRHSRAPVRLGLTGTTAWLLCGTTFVEVYPIDGPRSGRAG